jgi:parallel beta-helix repeat protein
MNLLGLLSRVRLILAIFCFVVLSVTNAHAAPGTGGVMVLEDNFTDLTNWTGVSGSAPTLISSDPNIATAPYLRQGNGTAKATLPSTVTGNWTLSFKALHTNYSRGLWIGLFDASGTQGYGISWDSSIATAYSGQGFVNIRKFSLTSEPVFSDTGTSLTPNTGSGHTIGATTAPMARYELSWDAATNTLYLSINGIPKASCTDTSYSSFSRIYLRGSTYALFDDVTLLTETLDSDLATQISNAINIQSYGAIGDGVTDNQSAIQSAVAAAKSAGKALYIPPGIFKHSGVIDLQGASMFGRGYISVLAASDPANSSFKLNGTSVELKSCRFTSPNATTRLTSGNSNAVFVSGATNFEIYGIYVEGMGTTGIISKAGTSSGGNIHHNWVSDNYSDGIHMTHGTYNVEIHHNRVRRTGDDMIAVVSYLGDGAICRDINIYNNDVRDQKWARGITAVGAQNVNITDNTVVNSWGAGIYAYAENTRSTYGNDGIHITNNTIIGANASLDPTINSDPSKIVRQGAIHVGGYTGQIAQNITIVGNTITDSRYRVISLSPNVSGCTISGNTINGSGNEAFYLGSAQNVTISGNSVSNIKSYGVYALKDGSGSLVIDNNQFTDINHGSSSGVDVIFVQAGGAFSTVTITDNHYDNPSSYPLDRYIECRFPTAYVSGNTTSTSEPIYVGP